MSRSRSFGLFREGGKPSHKTGRAHRAGSSPAASGGSPAASSAHTSSVTPQLPSAAGEEQSSQLGVLWAQHSVQMLWAQPGSRGSHCTCQELGKHPGIHNNRHKNVPSSCSKTYKVLLPLVPLLCLLQHLLGLLQFGIHQLLLQLLVLEHLVNVLWGQSRAQGGSKASPCPVGAGAASPCAHPPPP